PKITLGEQGFSFASAKGDFAVQLKGLLQVDSRTFFDDGGIAGNDTLLLRRARPILQGTVFKNFDYFFVPDFGGNNVQIVDAYLNYKFRPELQLRAGKFKVPVGLELLQSDTFTFFNERALPTDLVPNRDIGFQLHGDLFGGIANYAVGIFNGVGDARSSSNADFDDNKAIASRLFFHPFKKSSTEALQGFGIGVGGSYEEIQGQSTSALPSSSGYATVGQQQFFAYNPTFASSGTARAIVVGEDEHWRISPQAYYFYGPFGLLGEYVISDQKVTRTVAPPLVSRHLGHSAWQIAGGYVLTGEDASFGSTVVPRIPFNPFEGGWGAWQVVARYSQLDIDDATFPLFADPRTSASSAQEWSFGLNWYWNRNIRLSTSFSHTTFGGAGASGTSAPAVVTKNGEDVVFTRLQLAF
ncbi:MAG TPA: porin, partial [Clostridia bacterium]|nr:porin [Clostridia bacterium]